MKVKLGLQLVKDVVSAAEDVKDAQLRRCSSVGVRGYDSEAFARQRLCEAVDRLNAFIEENIHD